MRLRAFLCVAAAAGALRAQDGAEIDVNVRVVGPTGCPLPGVQVGSAKTEKPLGRTDASGVLRVRARLGEDIRVLDDVFAPQFGDEFVPVPIPTAKVTGAEVLLRCDYGVAGRMRFVDAETGADIQGVGWTSVDYRSRPVEQGIVHCSPGYLAEIVVTPPPGYLFWPEHDHFMLGPMSCFARSVSAVVPLRKAVEIEIVVKDHQGKPATGFEVASVEVGGVLATDPKTWDQKITPGRVRLSVPHFREGRVSVHLFKRNLFLDDASVIWTTKLGWAYEAKVSGSVRLPGWGGAEAEEPTGNAIGLGGGGDEPPPADRVGRIVIRARRFDGSPAAGLLVGLVCKADRRRDVEATLDADGQASIDDLAVGRWVVDLRGAGFVGKRLAVDVGEDVLEIDYDEPRGGRLEVTVVDRKGRPLPFAELSLSKPKDKSWTIISWDVDHDGCHRIDMFTDRAGCRTLHHLPPGELVVHARYGARKADATVTIESGAAGAARIVLDDEP